MKTRTLKRVLPEKKETQLLADDDGVFQTRRVRLTSLVIVAADVSMLKRAFVKVQLRLFPDQTKEIFDGEYLPAIARRQ